MNSIKQTNLNDRIDGRRFQLLGHRKPSTPSGWRLFPFRRRYHDPLLVVNMFAFNFADGWSRTFSKLHENVT